MSAPTTTRPTLTERQTEILRLVFNGCNRRRVALLSGIHPATIHDEITAIYLALDVHSGPQMVMAAIRRGLMPAPTVLARYATVVGLCRREHETLRHVGEGLSNAEIAAAMGITVATVSTHIRKSYRKLRVSGRTLAVVAGLRFGLIDPPAADGGTND